MVQIRQRAARWGFKPLNLWELGSGFPRDRATCKIQSEVM